MSVFTCFISSCNVQAAFVIAQENLNHEKENKKEFISKISISVLCWRWQWSIKQCFTWACQLKFHLLCSVKHNGYVMSQSSENLKVFQFFQVKWKALKILTSAYCCNFACFVQSLSAIDASQVFYLLWTYAPAALLLLLMSHCCHAWIKAGHVFCSHRTQYVAVHVQALLINSVWHCDNYCLECASEAE